MCEQRHDISIVDGCEMLIVFRVERPSEEGAPLVGDRTMWML